MRAVEGGSIPFSPALSTFYEAQNLFCACPIKASLIRMSLQFHDITEWPAGRGSAVTHVAVHCTREATEAPSRQFDRHLGPPGLDPRFSGLSERTGKAGRASRLLPGGALSKPCSRLCTQAPALQKEFAPTSFPAASAPLLGHVCSRSPSVGRPLPR